jgi:hypothetical protein
VWRREDMCHARHAIMLGATHRHHPVDNSFVMARKRPSWVSKVNSALSFHPDEVSRSCGLCLSGENSH